jgi:DNA-damage-inducible protein J
LSTARISVNIDGEVKQNAQRILGEIGMDMTTAIDLLLRTIVREERIPFDLRTQKSYREEVYRQFVRSELEKSKAEAADPDTKWLTHDDVTARPEEQRKARRSV